MPATGGGVTLDTNQMLRRQQVLADFGDFVLDAEHLDDVLGEACRLVGDALGIKRSKILEIQEDGRTLLVRAGIGWAPGIVGQLRLSMMEASSEAFSIRAAEPVISQNIHEEQRFEIPAFMRDAGVVALANVPIFLPGRRAYGLLEADAEQPHAFGEEDTQFLRTYATILGPVIDRLFQLSGRRESEERFRLTVEAVRDYAILVTDVDGRITDWLPGAEAVFGWSAAEAVGQSGSMLFTPEDREHGEAGKELDTARTHGVAPNVRWHACRNGGRVFIEGSVRALRDGNGVVTGFIKIGQDVTGRRRSEQLLRESEARLAAVLDVLPVGVGVTDAAGAFVLTNREMDRFIPDKLMPSPDPGAAQWLARHPDGRPLHPDEFPGQVALRGGRVVPGIEMLYRDPEGSETWTRVATVPLSDAGTSITGHVSVVSDIDEEVRARELLARSGAELERQVAERTGELMAAEAALRQHEKLTAIGQLTGGIAHDFNNLLQGLASSLDVLRLRLERGEGTGLVLYVERAEDAVERAGALVGRMLTFSRRQQIEPRTLNVDLVVRNMEDLIRRSVGPSIQVELQLQNGRWLAWCDPSQLDSALLNLCINARDAMPDGGWLTIGTEELELTAEQAARQVEARPGRYVSLSVRDTGAGIPADVLDRVFEPFFTTKPIGAGTGLGLSQVHGFVHQSGGFMEIGTTTGTGPGCGTTVRLHFPFHGDNPDARKNGAPPPVGPTVLLVEDEADIRQFTAEYLRNHDYRVLEAADGAAAVRLIETGVSIDVLVTDQGLPGGMAGSQVIAFARERRPDLPMVLVSGFAELPVVPTGTVLRKPYKMTRLLAVVGERLAQRTSTGDA